MSKSENPFKLERVSIRMVKDAPLYSDKPFDRPYKAVEALGKSISDMDREVMCVINVNTKSVPINCSIVSIGTLNNCLVSPREILKSAILSNAAGILLLHNHPSNDVTPSEQDLLMTKRMGYACDILGIDLLDHIIVGTDGISFFSFHEHALMPVMEEDKKQEAAICAAEQNRAR